MCFNSSMSLSKGELISTPSRPTLRSQRIIIHKIQRSTEKGTVRLRLGSNTCKDGGQRPPPTSQVCLNRGETPLERDVFEHGVWLRTLASGWQKRKVPLTIKAAEVLTDALNGASCRSENIRDRQGPEFHSHCDYDLGFDCLSTSEMTLKSIWQ